MKAVRIVLVALLPLLVLLVYFGQALLPRPIALRLKGSALLNEAAAEMARAIQRAETKTGNRLEIPKYLPAVQGPDYRTQRANAKLMESVAPNYSDLKAKYGAEPGYWQLISDSSTPAGQLSIFNSIGSGAADEASYALVNFGALADESLPKAMRVVDEAIALNPANSYFHYRRAMLLFKAGDREGCFSELQLGNASPQHYLPLAFPAKELMALDTSVLNSASLREQLVYVSLYTRSATPMLLFDRAQVALLIEASGKAPTKEELDELYQFARQQASQEPSCLISQLVGTSMFDMVLKTCEARAAELELDGEHLGKIRREFDATAERIAAVVAQGNTFDERGRIYFWSEMRAELQACEELQASMKQMSDLE